MKHRKAKMLLYKLFLWFQKRKKRDAYQKMMQKMTRPEIVAYLCVRSGSYDWWRDVICELANENVIDNDEAVNLLNNGGEK